MTAQECDETFILMIMFYNMIAGVITRLHTFVKTHRIVHLKVSKFNYVKPLPDPNCRKKRRVAK